MKNPLPNKRPHLHRRRKSNASKGGEHRLTDRRRLNRNILGTLLTLTLIFGLASAALFLRLSAGPLDLSFAESYVRPGLQRALGNQGRADFSRLELEWVRDSLRLRVADFSVKRADGELIAEAPGAYIGFSVFSLLRGITEPVALEVIKPVLALTILGDGSLELGGKPATKKPEMTMPALGLLNPQIMARLLPTGQAQVSSGALRFLRLEDVTVTITDYRWNITNQFDPFTVDLERTVTESVEVNISAADKQGGWHVAIDLSQVKNGHRSVALETKRFNLGSILPKMEAITVTDTALHARLFTRIDDKGLTVPLTGEISLEKGEINEKDAHIEFEPITLKAQLETDLRTINIAPAEFGFNGVDGIFSGRVMLPAAGDPTRPVRMEFIAENLSFNKGITFPEVDSVRMTGAYELANRTFWLDKLNAGTHEKPVVEMTGKMMFVGVTPSLELDCQISTVSVAAAKELWPAFTAPPARRWVRENVVNGQIENGSIKIAIPPGWIFNDRPFMRQFVQTGWRISGASIKLNPELPPATGVSAQVEATGNSARVDAQGGVVILPAGKVELPTAVFIADELSRKKPYGRLNMMMVGSVQALIEMAEKNDFALETQKEETPRGFQLSRLTGEGIANAEIRIPLWREAELRDAKTTIEAEFKNVSGDDVLKERDLRNGSFLVKIDASVLSAEGTALIDGMSARIKLNRDAARRTVLQAEVETDQDLRKKLGLKLSPFVEGLALVRLVEDFSEQTPQRIEVDLTNSIISIPQLAYAKPAKQEALLSFIPIGEKQVNELEDVILRSGNALLRGRILFDDKGAPHLIELSNAKLRADDDFTARVELSGGKTTAKVTGRSIDLKPFMSSLLASNQPRSEEQLEVTLDIDKAVGSNGESLRNLRLKLTDAGGMLRALELNAAAGKGTLTGNFFNDRGQPSLIVQAGDGGAVLRFLDIYTKIGGGSLTMTQSIAAAGQTANGVIVLDNFRIINEPGMQKLFGAAPQRQGQPKAIENNSSFDRLRIAFSRVPGAVRVNEGVVRNAAIGITFRGQLDFKREAIDIQGSFIPMYALNNLIARIPVVGLFMGGSNEGLLGVSFAVSGSLANPVLRINPVSAIAPGFLRGLFQAPAGGPRGPVPPGAPPPPR